MLMLGTLGVVFILCCFGLVCWVEWATSDTDGTIHTRDCLDWRPRGLTDSACPAHHGTDWFAPIREQVAFLDQLDGQLGVRHD